MTLTEYWDFIKEKADNAVGMASMDIQLLKWQEAFWETFKAGTEIICVDNKHLKGELTMMGRYISGGIPEPNKILIISDYGQSFICNLDRFRLPQK